MNLRGLPPVPSHQDATRPLSQVDVHLSAGRVADRTESVPRAGSQQQRQTRRCPTTMRVDAPGCKKYRANPDPARIIYRRPARCEELNLSVSPSLRIARIFPFLEAAHD